jgi:hypothetical protein
MRQMMLLSSCILGVAFIGMDRCWEDATTTPLGRNTIPIVQDAPIFVLKSLFIENIIGQWLCFTENIAKVSTRRGISGLAKTAYGCAEKTSKGINMPQRNHLHFCQPVGFLYNAFL